MARKRSRFDWWIVVGVFVMIAAVPREVWIAIAVMIAVALPIYWYSKRRSGSTQPPRPSKTRRHEPTLAELMAQSNKAIRPTRPKLPIRPSQELRLEPEKSLSVADRRPTPMPAPLLPEASRPHLQQDSSAPEILLPALLGNTKRSAELSTGSVAINARRTSAEHESLPEPAKPA